MIYKSIGQELGKKLDEDFNINPSNEFIWDPPVMPSALRGKDIPSGHDPDEQLDAIMEPLLEIDPDYVTRKDLGKDESGQYTIRSYIFTPKNYENTIIITGGIHGNEYTGIHSLMQFLVLLVTRYKEFPQLAYLRKNVRIVTIPIINMWGYANQKRQNINGVDLNRNFPIYWDNFKSGASKDSMYYKGETPFSEAETKILDEFLNEYKEATSHMDFHTTTVVTGEYVLYYPRLLKNQTAGLERLVRALKQEEKGEREVWAASKLPEFTTYSCSKYNMNVANPEFVNGLEGSTRDSTEMTRAMRWYGNVILQSAKLEKPSIETLDDPDIKTVKYKNTGTNPITMTNRVYNNIDQTMLVFRIKRQGILWFVGDLTFTLSKPAKVGFFVHMYQRRTTDFDYYKTKDNPTIEINRKFEAGTHTIPLNGAIPAIMTGDDPERAGEVVVRLRGKVSAGTATIENYQGNILFNPSSNGERYQEYNATGNELLGTEAMEQNYPN